MTENAITPEDMHQIARFVAETYDRNGLDSTIGYLSLTKFKSVGYNQEKVTP